MKGKPMKRTMRKLSANGDDVLYEYDETTSPEKLAEIEKEFNTMMSKGWIAADITDQVDTIIDTFDPKAEILLIPRIQGGI
jgi:hypothetical protein